MLINISRIIRKPKLFPNLGGVCRNERLGGEMPLSAACIFQRVPKAELLPSLPREGRAREN